MLLNLGCDVADDLGAFLQCCALIPLLNAQFAVPPPSPTSRTTHHDWDVCLWQNMGNTGHRTRGHRGPRTQTQAGRGQQGAPNPHTCGGRRSLAEPQGLRLFLTLFLGIWSFPQSQLDSQLMVRQTNPTPSFWKPIPKAALRWLGFLGGLRSGPCGQAVQRGIQQGMFPSGPVAVARESLVRPGGLRGSGGL